MSTLSSSLFSLFTEHCHLPSAGNHRHQHHHHHQRQFIILSALTDHHRPSSSSRESVTKLYREHNIIIMSPVLSRRRCRRLVPSWVLSLTTSIITFSGSGGGSIQMIYNSWPELALSHLLSLLLSLKLATCTRDLNK